MPYPLGHGASWLMPARQVASRLTQQGKLASNTGRFFTCLLHWRSEAARGPCASHPSNSVLLSLSLLLRRSGIWSGGVIWSALQTLNLAGAFAETRFVKEGIQGMLLFVAEDASSKAGSQQPA